MKRISAFCLFFHGDPRIRSLMSLLLPTLREQEQQPTVLIFFFPDLFLIICVHVCVSVCGGDWYVHVYASGVQKTFLRTWNYRPLRATLYRCWKLNSGSRERQRGLSHLSKTQNVTLEVVRLDAESSSTLILDF